MPVYRDKEEGTVVRAQQWLGSKKSWDWIQALEGLEWAPGTPDKKEFYILTPDGYDLVKDTDYVVEVKEGVFKRRREMDFIVQYERVR